MQLSYFVILSILVIFAQGSPLKLLRREEHPLMRRLVRQSGFEWGNSDNGINTVQSTTQGTTTIAVPGMGTTRSACEDGCQVTPQYDPFCGSNGVTYNNMQWFRCAQRCGLNITIKYRGACPR